MHCTSKYSRSIAIANADPLRDQVISTIFTKGTACIGLHWHINIEMMIYNVRDTLTTFLRVASHLTYSGLRAHVCNIQMSSSV